MTGPIDWGKVVKAEAKAARAAAAALASFEAAIQEHVDETARSRGYHGGFALAGYVTSTVPAWAGEAAAFVAWRDAVWSYAYGQLALVETEQRAQPSVSELIAELPAIMWPE